MSTKDDEDTPPAEADRRLLCPCGKKGECCCASCKSIFYCTPEHLKEDWDTHKSACKLIKKIKSDRKRGGPAWGFISRSSLADLNKSKLNLTSKQQDSASHLHMKKIQLHYKASYMNRQVIDDSGEKYGGPPLTLTIGSRSMVPALEEAVSVLQNGEIAEMTILPEANLRNSPHAKYPILLNVRRLS